MAYSERRAAGLAQRKALIKCGLPGLLPAAERALIGSRYGVNDLLEAAALFWTAARIARGSAVRMPPHGQTDRCALPMVI